MSYRRIGKISEGKGTLRMKEIYYFSYNLQFFAKEGNGGEKTEEATPKKLKDAREEGQVAKSQDIVIAFSLIGLFVSLKVVIGSVGNSFLGTYKESYGMIADIVNEPFTMNVASELVMYGVSRILLIAAPVYIVAFIIAFVTNVAQVKWAPTLKPLMPKFSKLNPISGFKRIFSMEKVMELIKSIAKIVIIAYVVYDALKEQWGVLRNLYNIPLIEAIVLIGSTVIDLGLKISMFFMVIAAVDFMYQKFKFKQDMKMTKQEIKDEYKQSEGDPHVKGQIKQRMREASRRRMMQELPQADVVITNPTHLAVAVKYDRENSKGAPIVIAKGADFLAEKIKEVARENDIEIVENKPLARMLYYNVEIGMEIPPELYQMVAEVLAYVYRLKGKV